MSISFPPAPRERGASSVVRLALAGALLLAMLPVGASDETAAAGVGHLVVSEIMTGGASASDELVELYNPSATTLPLEGLELVYVSASGATVTRRAAWSLGAAAMPPGSHLLVANELGVFAAIADAVYAGGMAATGGSVALRIQGASGAIDAVGWGNAAGVWMEGTPAVAPPAGSSLERLPGGSAGSTIDTDDNAADFAVRSVPDPQNSGSPAVPDAIVPGPTPTPDPTQQPMPTATPTSVPSGTPEPTAVPSSPPSMPIAAARALAEGSTVTVEGTALTASDFTDGGGYIADTTGGIAVLLDGGVFARGDRVVVTGTLDDRFAQRTVRAIAADAVSAGGQEPGPISLGTATIGELVEGLLVRVEGSIVGSATPLTSGLAFDLDDGSGVVRVVVGSSTGIDTAGWTSGRRIGVVGVVGQRDSSGSGTSGYRVQPRDAVDIVILPDAPPTPSPTPSGKPGPEPTATPPAGGVSTIAEARAADRNERLRVRGVITLAPGVVDPSSAVIQDGSGAILLRLGSEVGRLSRGQLIEAEGVRSTKSGMESLRVTRPPRQLGAAPEPALRSLRTGQAAEAFEAQLVVVRGALVASARRSASKTVSFEIDDGSGPLRVVAAAPLSVNPDPLSAGSWVEVRGVLGQETTGAQPLRGYRVWPRGPGDVRIVAGAMAAAAGGDAPGSRGGGANPTGSLDAIGTSGDADLRVGATLVLSAWPEMGIAGLLWDGRRLVAVDASSADVLASAVGQRQPPLALELGGLRELRTDPRLGIGVIELGDDADETHTSSSPPVPPVADLPKSGEPARWVTLVGRVSTRGTGMTLEVAGTSVDLDLACDGDARVPDGTVSVSGVALAGGERIVAPCDGTRAAPELSVGRGQVVTEAGRESAAGVQPADASGLEPALRWPSAALLVCAAILLGAALVARRRFRAGPGAASSAVPGDDPTDDRQPAPPQLTLVPVPRERGP